MERRSLLQGDMAPTHENEDVFDDEYQVDDFDGVADGLRGRGMDHDREGSTRDTSTDPPIVSRSAHYARDPAPTTTPSSQPSRQSTRKSRSYANPFASVEDPEDERTPSLTFEPAASTAHRSVSSASSVQYASTHSPRFGAGPSHPYGMYTQDTIQRSPSLATSSTATVRPSRRPNSTRNEPQHPYSMYPQGVDEGDGDDDDDNAVQPIPVGFPGAGESYRRQLGPDGEEQDFIGADGHTEQLPPYTRYPEDGPEKMPLLAPTAPTPLHSRAPVAGTDPTMSLMHTPLLPQTASQASMTDASELARASSLRHPSTASIERAGLLGNSIASEKSWKEKSWKEKRKTRFCGVPFWWYLLSVGVILFIAMVLGSVIGVLAEKNTDDSQMMKSSLLYDASAIATPTFAAPPTGTFGLSLSTPQETQAACLTDPGQEAAWVCDIAGQPAISIDVLTPPGSNSSGAYIFYNALDDQVCYGAQASWMTTAYSPFIAVQDNDRVASGPAFYFQQFYDKLVVLPEAALTPSSKKRDAGFRLDEAWLQQKSVVQPGEKPWFCVWNNTLLEAFIYIQEPITASYSLTASAEQPTSSQATAGTMSLTAASSTQTGAPDWIITTAITLASTTATFTGPLSAASAWSAHQEQQYDGDDDDDDNNYGHNRKRDAGAQSLPVYPYIVKLEERRLAGNTVTPYCQQYQILDDGGYGILNDASGNPIVVQLQESDPPYSAYKNTGLVGRDVDGVVQMEKRTVPGGCHCQWMSGQG